MEKCQKCGAALGAGATQCAYCGAPTLFARDLSQQAAQQQQHFAYQQHQLDLHQQARRQQEAQNSIKRTALHSVIWSSLGLLCCLVPVFGVVGVVMALRARKMAKKYQLVIPVTATLGLIVGAVSVLASIGVYTAIVIEQIQVSDRIEQLEQRLETPAQAAQLSVAAACDLAELRLLKDGIAGKSGTNLDDFECNGRLKQQAETALLDDYSFRASSAGRRHVKVCYRRGVRWAVAGFRLKNACDEPEDLPTMFPEVKSKSKAEATASGPEPTAPSAQASAAPATPANAASPLPAASADEGGRPH